MWPQQAGSIAKAEPSQMASHSPGFPPHGCLSFNDLS